MSEKKRKRSTEGKRSTKSKLRKVQTKRRSLDIISELLKRDLGSIVQGILAMLDHTDIMNVLKVWRSEALDRALSNVLGSDSSNNAWKALLINAKKRFEHRNKHLVHTLALSNYSSIERYCKLSDSNSNVFEISLSGITSEKCHLLINDQYLSVVADQYPLLSGAGLEGSAIKVYDRWNLNLVTTLSIKGSVACKYLVKNNIVFRISDWDSWSLFAWNMLTGRLCKLRTNVVDNGPFIPCDSHFLLQKKYRHKNVTYFNVYKLNESCNSLECWEESFVFNSACNIDLYIVDGVHYVGVLVSIPRVPFESNASLVQIRSKHDFSLIENVSVGLHVERIRCHITNHYILLGDCFIIAPTGGEYLKRGIGPSFEVKQIKTGKIVHTLKFDQIFEKTKLSEYYSVSYGVYLKRDRFFLVINEHTKDYCSSFLSAIVCWDLPSDFLWSCHRRTEDGTTGCTTPSRVLTPPTGERFTDVNIDEYGILLSTVPKWRHSPEKLLLSYDHNVITM